MKNSIEDPTPVSRHLVAEDQRVPVTASLFGPHFPLQIEGVVYSVAEQMAEDYQGGYWHFYTLGTSWRELRGHNDARPGESTGRCGREPQ